MVGHYERVGERMLDFAAGRPITLQRFPQGIEGKGFMQKNAAKHFPSSIRRYPVAKRDGGDTVYPIVDEAGDFAYLANQNTVTFHMWTSSAERPMHPDWMVIDLDPEAGDVEKVRLATRTIERVLSSFGIVGFVMATGSKGFHVWVPLDGSSGFDDVSLVARAIAGLAVKQEHRITDDGVPEEEPRRTGVRRLAQKHTDGDCGRAVLTPAPPRCTRRRSNSVGRARRHRTNRMDDRLAGRSARGRHCDPGTAASGRRHRRRRAKRGSRPRHPTRPLRTPALSPATGRSFGRP